MKREAKIGILVLLSAISAIWGINFLKGKDVFMVGLDKYYGVYKQINGLTEASPIYFKGFKVGSVRDIHLDPEDCDCFFVTFVLNEPLDLPVDTKAEIYSLDLMGSKGVKLVLGKEEAILAKGDTINTSVMGDFKDQVSNEVLPLKDKAERLIERIDSTLAKVKLEEILLNLNKTLENFEKISASFVKQTDEQGDVSSVINQADSLLAIFLKQGPKIDTTFSNLAGLSTQLNNAKLDSSIIALRYTLNETTSLMNKVNSGDNTIGMLLNDKELYYSFTEASANLNRLLMDVRHQPSRYVNFSAINLGKRVVVSEEAYGIKGIYYQVVINESEKPQKLDSIEVVNKYRVFEDYRNDKYVYSVGQESSYSSVKSIQKEVITEYPTANVVALENGQEISLKKAIKKTD